MQESKTYRLKLMVAARLLAEVTVLVILLLLPLAAWASGKWPTVPYIQVLLLVLPVVALLALPLYGFLTAAVRVNDDGLTTIALFRKRFVEWFRLKSLRFRSSGFWRRYVVTYDDGELTFPAWLDNQKELLDFIRARLPEEPSTENRLRIYKQDVIGLVYQIGRVLLGVLFIVVFWFFCLHEGKKTTSPTDAALLLTVGAAITGVIGWRCFVIASMPRWIQLTASELIVGSGFGVKRVPWSDVKKILPAFFLLPDGFMLKTKRGSFLLTESLDDADSLVEAIRDRISAEA